MHFRPVWIVLILLIPCLALTFYYSQVIIPGGEETDSFLPTTSYAFVLLLLNLDLIGFVVLLLLLSRNLIKAYFERRHRLFGSGFRTKLVAAFIGFSLIPTVLLALVASGLVNKAVDVWFSDQIEQVMRDSYDVARMQHAGHITLAVNSARAISHEIYREDMLLAEQRDLLVAAMARKRAEFGVAGIEVFSAKMETLTKALDLDVPSSALDLPIGQLVLQGFYVARSITVPIQRLAEATETIAQGDLSVRIEAKATDEIGTLIDSFNRMTSDLQGSKTEIEEANISLRLSNLELDRRRAYIETVVETIAAGLLSIDRNGLITNFNPSGERILGLSADRFRDRPANEAFKELKLDLFQTVYDRMLADQRDTLALEGQMEIDGRFLTIGLHGSRMKDEANKDLGIVLVFEDLTELIKAQKVAAWQEVARRVAHEIKNPLTPIQLSAQRLRKKFFEKSPDFETIFDEATNVIVNEVTSLKHMVDEFSKFARLPTPQMAHQSLHDVMNEVTILYRGAHKDVELIVELDHDLPSLNFDREQLKRVMVNLLDNAIQAMQQKGRVWLSTKYDTKRRMAVVSVADEGPGIAPEDQEKLFVPYFTRKKTGTGLGLAIVRRIITDHEGQIHASQNQPKGAVFTFELPV